MIGGICAQLDRIAAEWREPAPSISVPRESLLERLRALVLTPSPALRRCLAGAASLFLLGGLWLSREEILSRRQIARLTAERDLAMRNEKDLQERLAAERGEEQRLTSQLENEKRQFTAQRSRNAQALREARFAAQSPPAPIREGDFVELALTSGIERNSGEPRRLSIPTGIRMVKLQLELDPSINHHGYRVELNTAGGAQVWAQGRLTAQQSEWGRFVTLMIPALALQAGEYELILRGSTGDSKSEVAGYYYFIASPSAARKQ